MLLMYHLMDSNSHSRKASTSDLEGWDLYTARDKLTVEVVLSKSLARKIYQNAVAG